MDLSTTYMGLKLANPIIAGASPLSKNLDNYKRLEDAGAAAIVNYSLFEEEITQEFYELDHYLNTNVESFAESLTYFPAPVKYSIDPDDYLEHIYKAKKSVKIPVIASLNAHGDGAWVSYAKHIQQAGADALELNIYFLATDSELTAESIEHIYLDILRSVKANVSIPVAVKIGPFFSAMANMAKRLDDAGADSLVLFNRFYQPDIDLENLEVVPNVILSTPHTMRLPLRWIAILYGRLQCSLAATGGIHSAEDVLKMLMAGADVTMLCSVLLKNGIGQIETILKDMQVWMADHGYVSVAQMRGSLSQKSCANPEALERANYMKALQGFKPASTKK